MSTEQNAQGGNLKVRIVLAVEVDPEVQGSVAVDIGVIRNVKASA